MRLLYWLLLTLSVALAAPAHSQSNDEGFIERVAGKTFVFSNGALRFDRDGANIVISTSARSFIGKFEDAVTLGPDRIDNSKYSRGAKYTFKDASYVADGPLATTIGVLQENGDLRILTKWKNAVAYGDVVGARFDIGDARKRAKAGEFAVITYSGNKLISARAAFDRFEQQLRQPETATTKPPSTIVAAVAAPTVITTPSPQVAAMPSGPRIALVVGNSAYGANFGTLANAINDANLIAGSLRRAGFEVIQVNNADQRALRRAIQAFGARLAASGRGATGLFYYAGHGVQARGANYLVPVNSALESEADLEIEAVPAEAIMRQMEQSGIATSIVVLDACRNLPLARGTREGTRGLARMDAPNGSFVAYSTAPGSVATDGAGTNSPFAAALASEMARPGQQIEATFKNVRRAVMTATGGKQTPWDSSSLVDSFVFVP